MVLPMSQTTAEFELHFHRDEVQAVIYGGWEPATAAVQIAPLRSGSWSGAARLEFLLQARDERTGLPVGGARVLHVAVLLLRRQPDGGLYGSVRLPISLTPDILRACHVRIIPVRRTSSPPRPPKAS